MCESRGWHSFKWSVHLRTREAASSCTEEKGAPAQGVCRNKVKFLLFLNTDAAIDRNAQGTEMTMNTEQNLCHLQRRLAHETSQKQILHYARQVQEQEALAQIGPPSTFSRNPKASSSIPIYA